MGTTREALEAALAANPDDVAAHAAYADLLIEEDDPRGEFIQLQLALEDPNQPADRLRAMKQRVLLLQERHERDWLGPLGRFRDDWSPFTDELNVSPYWHRGWVSLLFIEQLTSDIVTAIAESRILSLLGSLHVREPTEEVNSRVRLAAMFTRLGRCPLTELRFGNGPGDELIDLLLETGVVGKLTKLELWRCRLTDASAELLAQHLRPGQLKTLSLFANQISALGATILADVGYPDIGRQEFDTELDGWT